jgi:dTDP-4-amino-4,6-dideoxygalactose transaminase
MRRLSERGIASQVHYIPLTLQPYYRARYGTVSLPGASAYYERALSLPLFPHMADEDVDRVVTELQEALGI